MIFGWTQDDGAMNVGPGNNIRNEEDMISILKGFATFLSPAQIKGLFALYPNEDFEEDRRNYHARKSPEEPEISVHWWRISRILRDLLFVCSSLDYGAEMVKQTRSSI